MEVRCVNPSRVRKDVDGSGRKLKTSLARKDAGGALSRESPDDQSREQCAGVGSCWVLVVVSGLNFGLGK